MKYQNNYEICEYIYTEICIKDMFLKELSNYHLMKKISSNFIKKIKEIYCKAADNFFNKAKRECVK